MAPNGLVHLSGPATGFTVIGAGKTAVDTCCWLLDVGVAPDHIRWIKPRDAWVFNRAFTQPLDRLGSSYMQLQAAWVGAAAQADDAIDYAHRLEASGVFLRFDEGAEPTMFKGSTMSTYELEQGRQIENVVRLGRVRRISTTELAARRGLPPDRIPGTCTSTAPRTVFERRCRVRSSRTPRINLEYVTVGVIPWSASTVGYIEATRDDVTEKNRLCPPVVFSGRSHDLLDLARSGLTGTLARGAEADVATWSDRARLNPAGAPRAAATMRSWRRRS